MLERLFSWLFITLLAVTLIASLLMVRSFVRHAHAHEWYPQECCHGKDCFSLDSSRVKIVAGSYWVDDGMFRIYFNQARPSPDDHYHICLTASQPPSWRCFFSPRGVS